MFHHVDLLNVYHKKLKNREIWRLFVIDLCSCRKLDGREWKMRNLGEEKAVSPFF